MASRRSKKSSHSSNLVGKYAFIAGVILAFAAGLIPNMEQFAWVSWLLMILGGLVGILNVQKQEQTAFLVAGIGLLTANTAIKALFPELGIVAQNISQNILAFVAPAVIVVSVIAIAILAED